MKLKSIRIKLSICRTELVVDLYAGHFFFFHRNMWAIYILRQVPNYRRTVKPLAKTLLRTVIIYSDTNVRTDMHGCLTTGRRKVVVRTPYLALVLLLD